MILPSTWEEKIARCRSFWEGKSVDRLMIGALIRPDIFPEQIKASDGEPILPESIDIPGFLEFYETEYASWQYLLGDLPYVATPASGDPWGLPWMEAILGCPIRRSGLHAWADAWLSDWNLIESIRLAPQDNPWLEKLLEFIDALIYLSAGRFPIGTCLMRGPSDLARAMREGKQFGFDLIEAPEKTSRLLEFCARSWVKAARLQLERLPWFNRGKVSGLLPMWAPGNALVTQEDASFYFSPSRYASMLFPADRIILQSFDYPIFHLHSGYVHILDDLLRLDWKGAIDLSRDPNGPSLETLIPILEKIQNSGKRLIFHGSFSVEEIQFIKKSIQPVGTCLMLSVQSVSEANQLLEPFIA